jgi:hypothetical protein
MSRMDGGASRLGEEAAGAAGTDGECAKAWHHMAAAALASGCVAWRKRRLAFCGEEREENEWFCAFHCSDSPSGGLAGRVRLFEPRGSPFLHPAPQSSDPRTNTSLLPLAALGHLWIVAEEDSQVHIQFTHSHSTCCG